MELFEEIRRGHAAGEMIKGLAKKHGVHRRMVRQAIASAIPPERKHFEKFYRSSRLQCRTTNQMEQEFKAGDVVELKSGGPRMTIEGIAKYGVAATHETANCVWFEKTSRKTGLFELHALRHSSEERTTTLL